MAVKIKAKKKNPITDGTMSQLKLSVTSLAKRQARHAKQPFSFDDLLLLFVEPQHRKVLKEAYDLAAPPGVSFKLHVGEREARATVGFCVMDFSWTSSTEGAFLPPNINTTVKPAIQLQDDCPPELRERFSQTIRDLSDISYRFGEVMWVLDELNKPEVCPSAAAIRYYWPGFLTLLKETNTRFTNISLKAAVEQLQDPDPRAAGKARIPWYVLGALKHTNETIATALLIEPGSEPPLPVPYRMLPVQYEVRSPQNNLVIYKFAGLEL